jgi:hypothetical protein
MSKPKSKRFVAGGNPAFDERSPGIQRDQKKQAFVGGNPGFDERKIVQAVKKIAEISEEKKDEE